MQKVYQVYRNLHNGKCRDDGSKAAVWSIKDKETGLVVMHADSVAISNPRFVVNESGRQRVLKEQRKNVHAYVEGRLSAVSGRPYKGRMPAVTGSRFNGSSEFMRASYNPYKAGHFTTGDVPLSAANEAVLNSTGLWVQ